MIKKIISGGQTGAERAALDAALKVVLSHSGWMQKGRKAEDGHIPDKYKLQEMTTASYRKRIQKNVLESNGTVIFSHGTLTGVSKLTKKMAEKHHKPCLHINLNKLHALYAVPVIRTWLFEHGVEVLNVAGSRASNDPDIYDEVLQIFEGLYWTSKLKDQLWTPITKSKSDETKRQHLRLPKTVDEAVDQILAEMSFEERTAIAYLIEGDLAPIQHTLTIYLREQLKDSSVNRGLMEDCVAKSETKDPDEAEASKVIIKVLWKRLQGTHRLRVVK